MRHDNAPPVDDRLAKLIGYSRVPKEPFANLEYRRKILDLAASDTDARQQLWILCRRDLLFFVNSFLFIYEPRIPAVLPFLTYPFQDRVLLTLDRFLGKRDIGIEKSRDMGMTWMFLTVFFHRWLFYHRHAYGLVSRTEECVDSSNDPDCLMWKLDFHLEHLPAWMVPPFTRVKCNLTNHANHSVITGYAATADVARGGRKTAFGMDELGSFRPDDGFAAWASTQHVSNCRVATSTPHGMAGIFAEQMNATNVSMVKMALHWTLHPLKRPGLYHTRDGILHVLDNDYRYQPDYPFVLDGKVRSPWYDEECRRNPVPALIAQELDLDYGGSGYPFFDGAMIERHATKYACPPFLRGELDFTDDYQPLWQENPKGRLCLWLHLTADGEPPPRNYVIGCDVATGTGGEQSTNSVASILDRDTGEKVGEYSIADESPERFAEHIHALRQWFHGSSGIAFLIWEDNGPGLQFRKRTLALGMAGLYWRESEKVVSGKRTKLPGWHTNRENKRALLGEYSRAIDKDEFVNHSRQALEEMLHYIHQPSGAVDHDRAKITLDPTSAGENHGDRVIADALAWKAIGSVAKIEVKKQEQLPPYGSMAWRWQRREEEKRQRQESWL